MMEVTPPGSTIDTMLALWRRERLAERERFRIEREAIPWKERLQRGLALAELVVEEALPAPGGRTVVCVRTLRRDPPFDRHHIRLRAGDPVVLYLQAPDEPGAVRAIVERWRGPLLGLALDGELPDAFEDDAFRLEREAPEATFERGVRALERLKSARGDAALSREMAYGKGVPESGEASGAWPRGPIVWLDAALDDAQRLAIETALRTTPLAILHGPPGTGKTRSLVEMARQARARDLRILAVAPSNVAVDNLVERFLATGVGALRLGHPARVLPEVEPHTLDARVDASEAARLAKRWTAEANEVRRRLEKKTTRGRFSAGKRSALFAREFDPEARTARREAFAESRRLLRDARELLRGAEQVIVAQAPVICTTLALADHPALRAERFDLVLCDEATQAPDPILWNALLAAPRAILAGDPQQLPPTIIDAEAARGGLGVSLFERLQRRFGTRVGHMLETQHRMHRTIMGYPSQAMYGGRLVAHPRVAEHLLEGLPGVAADPLRAGPLVFVDTAGTGFGDEVREPDRSTRNPEMAVRTAAEARRILSRGLAPAALAVLTPYDAQVGALRHLLAEEMARGVEVGSIDGFQGREKEAIVLDLVRSNDRAEVGFLSDTRRMNVALTRARRFLLVVGDSATIGAHPFYAAFLAFVEDAGTWVSAFADDASPLEMTHEMT